MPRSKYKDWILYETEVSNFMCPDFDRGMTNYQSPTSPTSISDTGVAEPAAKMDTEPLTLILVEIRVLPDMPSEAVDRLSLFATHIDPRPHIPPVKPTRDHPSLLASVWLPLSLCRCRIQRGGFRAFADRHREICRMTSRTKPGYSGHWF